MYVFAPYIVNVSPRLFTWALRASANTNRRSERPTAMTAATGSIPLPFSGLIPGTKYLGSIVYGGSPALPNPTLVGVDR